MTNVVTLRPPKPKFQKTIPRGAQETLHLKGLRQGLGENCSTDLQSVLGWPPKLTGHCLFGPTVPIKTYDGRKADIRVWSPLGRVNFDNRERLSARLAILTADDPAESCAPLLLPARGAAS
jgi:hypothetical protein